MGKRILILLSVIVLLFACDKKEEPLNITSDLTIFFVNDMHGQLDNFSKIKYIIDEERKHADVIVTSGGDIFSGNPVVDNYTIKGYPIIDVMNRCGFDVSVVGNHEFDYGEDVLKDRMQQANFDWVCANVDMGSTAVPEPYEYTTIVTNNYSVTFLGLIETNGKPGATIPSTHPFRVENFTFEKPDNVVHQYKNIKDNEGTDLYIAMTHIGYGGSFGDSDLADEFPYFDMIIGGHSHSEINTIRNGIPIFQAGSYLNKLGKVELEIGNREILEYKYDLIDLNAYPNSDQGLKDHIDNYKQEMAMVLDEVIGNSLIEHDKSQLGCFYTDALRQRMEVDITFQNSGGIRSGLNAGNITVGEIYEIDPFNNHAFIYEMSIADIKAFLKGSTAGFYYSGVKIERVGNEIEIRDVNNDLIADETVLRLGINDYIPAVYDNFFTTPGEDQGYTTAEALLYYLKNINDQVLYSNCDRYFDY